MKVFGWTGRRCRDCGGACAGLVMILSMVVLVGCATRDRASDLLPPVQVSEMTWWQVDSDIGAASLAARGPSGNYARGFMDSWRGRIHERTEADFIPWLTGYWTQQWLAIKVAWYKLSTGEGPDPAVRRLAIYLQEQYHDRVLAPVVKEIDPDAVRGQATKLYIQLLGEQLQAIPRRYGVPQDQFDRRLKGIPAIALAPRVAPTASLYEIVHADPIANLPAYVALMDQIRKAAGGIGPTDARISPVAKRASEKLVAKLATSGGASAAAAAAGGVAGIVISLGAAGFGAFAHEKDRPEMEAQLRENLDAALDDTWQRLMEDPATGVLAGVFHIATQIERGVAKTLTQPLELAPVPRGLPLSGERSLWEEDDGDNGLADDRQPHE